MHAKTRERGESDDYAESLRCTTSQPSKETIMPRIVDYVVVADAQFRLPTDGGGSNREFSFTLPNDTVTGTRGVLSYVVIPSSPNLTYTITLNGAGKVSKAPLIDQQHRTVHEVFGGLSRGVNTLVVKKTSSSGSIAFSGIVLSVPRDSHRPEKAGTDPRTSGCEGSLSRSAP
jgi:hypothetical protein